MPHLLFWILIAFFLQFNQQRMLCAMHFFFVRVQHLIKGTLMISGKQQLRKFRLLRPQKPRQRKSKM